MGKTGHQLSLKVKGWNSVTGRLRLIYSQCSLSLQKLSKKSIWIHFSLYLDDKTVFCFVCLLMFDVVTLVLSILFYISKSSVLLVCLLFTRLCDSNKWGRCDCSLLSLLLLNQQQCWSLNKWSSFRKSWFIDGSNWNTSGNQMSWFVHLSSSNTQTPVKSKDLCLIIL